MKYNQINRLTNNQLVNFRKMFLDNERSAIREVLKFYYSQINDILIEANKSEYIINDTQVNLSFEDDTYNNRANILSVKIQSKQFVIYLEEMFNNCAILVSTNTTVHWDIRNLGIGTLLHAIKEDVAKIAGYSFLMYTDIANETVLTFNQKIMVDINARELFKGFNKRTDNMIAIWIKDLNEYYDNREKVTVEVIEQETI